MNFQAFKRTCEKLSTDEEKITSSSTHIVEKHSENPWDNFVVLHVSPSPSYYINNSTVNTIFQEGDLNSWRATNWGIRPAVFGRLDPMNLMH